MKTDRELLELAAKAAGIVGVWHERSQCIHVTDCVWWVPLTDDGDALRLAYALGMDVDFGACRIVCGDEDYQLEWDGSSGDISAARRAIVRAAAAIGEAMQ